MLSCVLFTGKGRKTITVNNVHELILQKQEKKDEAKVLPIKKNQKTSIQKEVIKMGHDKRPNVDTYSVSDTGHVNPSHGTVPSATGTRWRQPLSQECVLFSHMLFIFQIQNKVLKYFCCPNLILLHSEGLQRFLKSFKKRIYHKALQINFFVPPKFQVHIRYTLSYQCLPKRWSFFKAERQNLFTILHRICSPSCREFLLSPQWHRWWMKKKWNKIPPVQSYMCVMIKTH